MYIDVNLKAYYNTNMVDTLDDFFNTDNIGKRKVKMMIRLIINKQSTEFSIKQLAVYGLLINYIHKMLFDLKDELLEELNVCSEISFDKEREGEINAGMFLQQQNTYKDIHKIITTILKLNIDDTKTINFEKNEDNINVLVIQT
jgi:hypothetical protein